MDGEKAALVEMGDLLDDVRSGSQLVPPFFLLLPAMVRKLTIASIPTSNAKSNWLRNNPFLLAHQSLC
jgi:hypothetical protein